MSKHWLMLVGLTCLTLLLSILIDCTSGIRASQRESERKEKEEADLTVNKEKNDE